jgi:hypothetical protein
MWVTHSELEGLFIQINKLEKRLKELEEKPLPSTDLRSRLEDLELWKGKLHSMITTTNQRGKEVLNKQGKILIGESVRL